jgi:hypothetical protein
LKAGELAEAEAEAVLLATGVEEAWPLELAPEPELELAVAEPAAVLEAAEEDSPLLELPLAVVVAVAVALALVSVVPELEVVLLAEAEVVSTGGTTMGWPAEEHWLTTALETARVG